MNKLQVLINAYAISPNLGSEPGMGWNWVINIANYCNVHVITEGEWQDEIETAVATLPQKENIKFYYLQNSEKVRRMCWNQGDWRFYWYYRKWQKRAYHKALEIIEENRIDVIHQLNMIGFREPGYLWKIKDIPFVWGPVGGMELMPVSYLQGTSVRHKFFNRLKNLLNRIQYIHSSRVKKAIERSSVIIAAVKGVQDTIQNIYHKESILINETGVDINPNNVRSTRIASDPLKVIWVGKFDFRKQLPLAIKSIIALGNKNIEFHVCGSGTEKAIKEMATIAEIGGIGPKCYWHGNISNNDVKKMMAESDLLMFTSIMDATSTVVLEAISVGLPILCFNTCGFGPIVNRFAGITIELSNPNQSVFDFARILNSLYEDREKLNHISENILRNRGSLTWRAKGEQTFKIYNSIFK